MTESSAPLPPITDNDIEGLRGAVAGTVLLPGEPPYDDARAVWNGRFDGRPELIVGADGPEDVRAAVAFARRHDRPVGVKGGGHDYAGMSAVREGVLVDLSGLATVDVDAGARTARVGGGATWGAFDAAAQRSGLATPGPTVSTVGVGGSTLGGGSGWLVRRLGLALDNLQAAEVVTADGRLVRASPRENADLFWALRGSGWNFGVVTALEYRLHALGPELLTGQVFHRLEHAPAVLRAYRDIMAEAPDALMAYAFFLRVPPVDGFLEAYHGQVVMDLAMAWAGPVEDGEAGLRPLRTLGDPILDTTAPMAYAALQQSFDQGLPRGARYVSRAHYLDALDDAALDTILARAADLQGAFTMAYLEPLGGAVGRVPVDDTAFPHRGAAFSFHLLAGWTDPGDDARIIDWAGSVHRGIGVHANGGVYVNLLSGEEDRVRAAYGPAYDRLARIKAEWDPDNRFRLNHNIPPAVGDG
ncbi:MAG: FAD-binding oxidoreductase [Gemmatimonadota bacterium]